MYLDKNSQFSALKAIIQSNTGIPSSEQRLYSQGHFISDDCHFQNLQNEANIHLLFRIVGGRTSCDICNTAPGTLKCIQCEGKVYCDTCSAINHRDMDHIPQDIFLIDTCNSTEEVHLISSTITYQHFHSYTYMHILLSINNLRQKDMLQRM